MAKILLIDGPWQGREVEVSPGISEVRVPKLGALGVHLKYKIDGPEATFVSEETSES